MALSQRFKHKLGADVSLILSTERGQIIGRAEYTDQVPSYLVRYVNAQGVQTEAWLRADDFISVGA